MDIPRYERLWLGIGIGTLILFLFITGFMGFSMGLHPTDGMKKTVEPEKVTQSPPFDHPGLGPLEAAMACHVRVACADHQDVGGLRCGLAT